MPWAVDSSWIPWIPGPKSKVVYGKVKAGPVVGTAAGDLLQKGGPGAEQFHVQRAPNIQRDNDPVGEVRARFQYGIWVPRTQNRRGRERPLQGSLQLFHMLLARTA